MKYYIIAGEASGDLHGSNLVRALKEQDPQADVRCWGGDRMEAAGAVVVKHYRDLAFMGFLEVLRHLRTIFRNIDYCKKDIQEYRPEVLILIDYPGFNLRIAGWAAKQGIRVAYYISPQVWAWKESRVKQIRRDVDLMLVILPFEKEFYARHNYEVSYVGHPLVEVIDREADADIPVMPLSEKPIVALLPGSRRQEISQKLPLMLEVSARFPDCRFAIARAPGQPESLYREYLKGYENVMLVQDAYYLLKQAKAALVTSGTATLETALFGVPQVVCYKGNPVSYQLARMLIKVPYISLVNLILGRPVVRELIQGALNVRNLEEELKKLLYDPRYRDDQKQQYLLLRNMLGDGSASRRAAEAIIGMSGAKAG